MDLGKMSSKDSKEVGELAQDHVQLGTSVLSVLNFWFYLHSQTCYYYNEWYHLQFCWAMIW
jgi:hypothetical protein